MQGIGLVAICLSLSADRVDELKSEPEKKTGGPFSVKAALGGSAGVIG